MEWIVWATGVVVVVAGAPAVAPGGPLDRAQQALGPHLGQVPEVVLQHALLDRHLRRRIDVLHCATAANIEMRRLDA